MKRLLIIALLALPACGLLPRKKPKPKPLDNFPRKIGEVAMVNSSLNFVLVDVGSVVTPQTGQALKTFRQGEETGVLTVSPENKRPFIVGDIVRGAPEAGDIVFQ